MPQRQSLPFRDLAMAAKNTVFDVSRMVPKTAQHYCLVHAANNIHGIVSLYKQQLIELHTYGNFH